MAEESVRDGTRGDLMNSLSEYIFLSISFLSFIIYLLLIFYLTRCVCNRDKRLVDILSVAQ